MFQNFFQFLVDVWGSCATYLVTSEIVPGVSVLSFVIVAAIVSILVGYFVHV